MLAIQSITENTVVAHCMSKAVSLILSTTEHFDTKLQGNAMNFPDHYFYPFLSNIYIVIRWVQYTMSTLFSLILMKPTK